MKQRRCEKPQTIRVWELKLRNPLTIFLLTSSSSMLTLKEIWSQSLVKMILMKQWNACKALKHWSSSVKFQLRLLDRSLKPKTAKWVILSEFHRCPYKWLPTNRINQILSQSLVIGKMMKSQLNKDLLIP